jgi:hypothetical protein
LSPSSRRFRYLGTILTLSLFGGALYLFHRQVAAYDPEGLSWERVIAAIGSTAGS